MYSVFDNYYNRVPIPADATRPARTRAETDFIVKALSIRTELLMAEIDDGAALMGVSERLIVRLLFVGFFL